jgi:hypothetical protein
MDLLTLSQADLDALDINDPEVCGWMDELSEQFAQGRNMLSDEENRVLLTLLARRRHGEVVAGQG